MPNQPLFTVSSALSAVSNHLKPHKSEAIQRLRYNALFLLTTLVISYLLPLPSLPSALRTAFRTSHHVAWSKEWLWEWMCLLELAVVTLFGYNALEAIYAIKYPRKPLPPLTSPMRVHTPKSSKATPKRPFKVLSPNSSPQPQKPFAFSPSSSTSLGSASMILSSSSYAQSPVSTPSRVLHYTIPPSSSTNTQASSTSEFLSTPSPVISAYRGKHMSVDVGRSLDGSFLSRIVPDDLDDDDE
ncbi:hypothetical protein M413DRAFT_444375 [Hebeloma cylindrosporum]|uniref:Uncharacterized protein n=1 Tax=Hebeloma cylindrosporum TaxID=76867 RepID=A0A0C2XYK7_HEBCY|nr:hypothetical protein M413DRAFT_444375 [Hebeloma cylindrosporum h7]